MINAFEYNLILKREGVYDNDTTDEGGETVLGISRVHNPNFEGWKIVDKLKKESLDLKKSIMQHSELIKLIRKYYYNKYLKPMNADDLHDTIRLWLFDFGVHEGVKTAIKLLQKRLNLHAYKKYSVLSVDGVNGIKTKDALNMLIKKRGITFTMWTLRAGQQAHYEKKIESRPHYEKYIDGFTNRARGSYE